MTFDQLRERLQSHGAHALDGASEEDIQQAEAKLGVVFAGSYRQFLKEFGWADVGHLELYGLGREVPPYLDLVKVTLSERSEMEPPLPTRLVPVMNDGGGNLYCLDLRNEQIAEPPVVFWDHTRGRNQEPDQVAASFTKWMLKELESL
jgi:cell wall assembly regulator SMI1